MDGAQFADWLYRIVVLIGGGGVLVWMGCIIKAMKTTVDAQEKTISAQTTKMDMLNPDYS